jgi:hypothetical protein
MWTCILWLIWRDLVSGNRFSLSQRSLDMTLAERTMCCVNFAPRDEGVDGEEGRERRKTLGSSMENSVSPSMPGSY